LSRAFRRRAVAYRRDMRPPRFEIADGIYHVTSRAARSVRLFRSDDDRKMFLDVLGIAIYRAEWVCIDYCLMGTHYHLIVETPLANLSAGMKRLNWLYSRTFNEIHDTKGHLFESRFTSEFIQTPDHFLNAIRYVALNPVEASLCASAADWRWSGYRALAGLEEPRRFHDAYRALVELDDRIDVARRQLRWSVEGLAPTYAAA
jgi:putative transposase